jgi:hypothetical protein
MTYIGNCEFELAETTKTRVIMDLDGLREVYRGRRDHTEQFLETKVKGDASTGGYITEARAIDQQGPWGEVEVTIALPPDFLAYTLAQSRAIQTASKGAEVTNSQILDGYSEVSAQKQMTFIAPQHIYSYFASKRPPSPRFTSPPVGASPTVLTSSITARGTIIKESWVTEHKMQPPVSEKTWYGNAPLPLVSATAMSPQGLITGFTSDPIPGTPWYRCQDTISYVFQGTA